MSRQRMLVAALVGVVVLLGALAYWLTREVKTFKAVGEACAQDAECGPQARCCEGACADTLECKAAPVEAKEVEPEGPNKKSLGRLAQSAAPTDAQREARLEARDAGTCKQDSDCATGLMTCDAGSGKCVEPAMCWSDSDCLGENKCEQGRCTDKLKGCRAFDCGKEGKICIPAVGACEATVCKSDDDCVGERRCQLPQGNCWDCLDASDCEPGELCEANRCRKKDECFVDGHCPEDKPYCDSQTGKCKAKGECVDDAMEPNDKKDQAKELPDGDSALNLCRLNDDWFTFEVAAGEGFLVAVATKPGAPYVDLRLYDANRVEVTRCGGTFPEGFCAIPVEQSEETMRYYVRAQSEGEVMGMPYTLRLSRAPQGFCAEDKAEPNDTPDEAIQLTDRGHQVFALCDGREDWFVEDLKAGTEMAVEVEAVKGVPPVVAVFGPESKEPLAFDDSEKVPKEVIFKAPVDGRYYVRLYPAFLEDRAAYILKLAPVGWVGKAPELQEPPPP